MTSIEHAFQTNQHIPDSRCRSPDSSGTTPHHLLYSQWQIEVAAPAVCAPSTGRAWPERVGRVAVEFKHLRQRGCAFTLRYLPKRNDGGLWCSDCVWSGLGRRRRHGCISWIYDWADEVVGLKSGATLSRAGVPVTALSLLPGNGRYYIRKAKAIRAVVQQFRPHALWDEDLVGVLKSLLDDNMFLSDYYANEAFPELFPSAEENPTETQTAGSETELKMTQESKGSWLCHRLYSHADYSDFMISGDGKDYRVHKAVVCPQSEYFSTACRAFKEAETNRIDLQEDDPQAVQLMVCFFYHEDYGVTQNALTKEDPREILGQPIVPQDSSQLDTHIKVHVLADKYCLDKLKALSQTKFRDAAGKYYSSEDFLQAAREVYKMELQALKAEVVGTFARSHEELLRKEMVRNVLLKVPKLGTDVLLYLNPKPRKFEKW
ncbi:hypothetical protein OOU_Y34scaffold00864g3 [Pyricularia oryzae Y34]|uniref:BTB domain-containing protein n=2 Tax=Pyricularia oryzae TaxID=318829 RepID=A0AA97PGM0_PYRO3|nr:hypothetical protein OOU_Y34scaffold00864g3 [Pyricularia oryzae Y34]